MKRVFVLMAASAAFLFAVDPADGVREAAQGWRQGAIKQDQAALQRYLADELVYTHGNGKRQTGTNIRIYGKVAVLTGLVDVKTPKSEPYRVRTLLSRDSYGAVPVNEHKILAQERTRAL